jgi:hypothetical protein
VSLTWWITVSLGCNSVVVVVDVMHQPRSTSKIRQHQSSSLSHEAILRFNVPMRHIGDGVRPPEGEDQLGDIPFQI